MRRIEQVTGTGVPLLLDDIDTDRIIPARFLRCVSFEGIGEHAFEDDRKQDPSHPFNKPEYRAGTVLVAGRNFGCGSSREHAPQSLMRWGLQAIVAESFAEIFFGNCTSLGIPAVTAARSDLELMAAAVQANPQTPVKVDLLAKTVTIGSQSYPIKMPASAHESLTTGQWDFLGQLLEAQAGIKGTASKLPYMSGYQVQP
jgi:3-isopropylmalate/(R)-2-methylmalate dehydratase small subunit